MNSRKKPSRVITTDSPEVRKILESKGQKITPEKGFYEILPDKSWMGERCFIVGGGPSLEGFDFHRLFGEKIIAVNTAFLDVPFADICFFMDVLEFFKWTITGKLGQDAKQKFAEFQGFKVLLDLTKSRDQGPPKKLDYSDVYFLYSDNTLKFGFPKKMEDGLYHGNNSGYAAIQLAICLGANPIFLLGFDMRVKRKDADEENTHYHKRYPRRPKYQDTLDSFIPGFKNLADLCKIHNIKVWNCSMESRLYCFRKIHVNEILNA